MTHGDLTRMLALQSVACRVAGLMRDDGKQVCKEEQEEEEWRPVDTQQHLGKHTQDRQQRSGKTEEEEIMLCPKTRTLFMLALWKNCLTHDHS